MKPGVKVRFVENTADTRYVLLPTVRFEATVAPAEGASPGEPGLLDLSEEDLTSRPIAVKFLQDDFTNIFADKKADVGPSSDTATADRTRMVGGTIYLSDDVIGDVTGLGGLPGGASDLSLVDTGSDADKADTGKDG